MNKRMNWIVFFICYIIVICVALALSFIDKEQEEKTLQQWYYEVLNR